MSEAAVKNRPSAAAEEEEKKKEEDVDWMNSCTCDLDNFPFHSDKTTISAVSRHRRRPPIDLRKIGR